MPKIDPKEIDYETLRLGQLLDMLVALHGELERRFVNFDLVDTSQRDEEGG